MKEKEQRHRIELGGNPVNTEFTYVYFPYAYILQIQKGERRQKTDSP